MFGVTAVEWLRGRKQRQVLSEVFRRKAAKAAESVRRLGLRNSKPAGKLIFPKFQN